MFFNKIPQLTYKEVITGLKKLGFQKQPNKSTAHQQWVADNPFRKVTVDKHIAPFDVRLVKSMANQAGINVKEFCRYCKDKKYLPSLFYGFQYSDKPDTLTGKPNAKTGKQSIAGESMVFLSEEKLKTWVKDNDKSRVAVPLSEFRRLNRGLNIEEFNALIESSKQK